MTINLRPEIRGPLAEKLADILARSVVNNGRFLDHRVFDELAELEERLRGKTKTWEQCQEFISDTPFFDLFFELLSERLQESRKYDSQIDRFLLKTLSEYSDTTSLSERLIR